MQRVGGAVRVLATRLAPRSQATSPAWATLPFNLAGGRDSWRRAAPHKGIQRRCMGRAMSTNREGLVAQLMSIPEVKDARQLYEAGKFPLALQMLGRAAEICKASRMPELSLLTEESLAHIHGCMGDFEKEQMHWNECVGLHDQLAQGGNVEAAQLEEHFRCLHLSCLSDITMGTYDEAKIGAAREIVWKQNAPHNDKLLGLTEGLHQLATATDPVEFFASCERECEEQLGSANVITSAARIFHGISLIKAGSNDPARSYMQKAADGLDVVANEMEADVKIEALHRLAKLSLGENDIMGAETSATAALKTAESVQDPSSIAACVHALAKVRIAAGDFVVAEGLLRSCMATLQVPKGASPNVWDVLLLQDATDTYASLLEKLIFNNNSRKAEGDQARDRLAQLEEQFPITSSGAEKVRGSVVRRWYRDLAAPLPPILLQEVP
mmetsp:Transcript_5663/g.14354  ORF Transcript_5663/g.14354 Transcript_5663/m.14354 type:complete len:441 (-) Transcript_5663:1650-2972(-)